MLEVLDIITENTTMCGGIAVPNELFNVVALIIRIIKIVVPVLLIIWGMLDFAKSVIAKSEDDVKKYRKAFIQRLVSGILVFLIVVIVQLVVNLLAGVEADSNNTNGTTNDTWACSKKFITGVEAGTDEGTDTSESTGEASA
mgnify:FL=1